MVRWENRPGTLEGTGGTVHVRGGGWREPLEHPPERLLLLPPRLLHRDRMDGTGLSILRGTWTHWMTRTPLRESISLARGWPGRAAKGEVQHVAGKERKGKTREEKRYHACLWALCGYRLAVTAGNHRSHLAG